MRNAAGELPECFHFLRTEKLPRYSFEPCWASHLSVMSRVTFAKPISVPLLVLYRVDHDVRPETGAVFADPPSLRFKTPLSRAIFSPRIGTPASNPRACRN